jgi:hypothetical protein
MDSINLTDACRLRSNELTRILAGCVAINPVKVLPMIYRLRPQSLTDDAARKFIVEMREQLEELQKTDYYHQGEIFVDWARENHLLFDYALWMTEVKDAVKDAENAVKGLQKLAIALNTIEGLQDWLLAREEHIYGR